METRTSSQLRWQSIAKGLGTYVSVVDQLANSATRLSVGPRYFYSVQLRHLTNMAVVRPVLNFDVVAELGSGDAIGMAICAQHSGTSRYKVLDRIAFGLRTDSLQMLDKPLAPFQRREPIAGDDELPGVYPKTADHAFSRQLTPDKRLAASLARERVTELRDTLTGDMRLTDDALVSYAAPWYASDPASPGIVDLLVAQAVMEHADNVDGAYAKLCRWREPRV